MAERPELLADCGKQISSEEVNEITMTCPSIDSNSNVDFGSQISDDRLSKKERYFALKQDKNIFMKIIHPSYQKRSQWFRKLFIEKGLMDESTYLASYSCAYQREILAQGRMFISQSHVCFYANIFGWETNLVIPMSEIKEITKQKAAFIFPNSIQLERKSGEKLFFASFVNRDKTYQLLTTALDRESDGKPMTPEEVWEFLNNSEDKSPSSTPSIGSPPSMTVHHTHNGATSKINSAKIDKDNCSQSSSLASDFAEEEILDEAGMSTIETTEECSVSMNSETDPNCPCAEHTGRLLMDTVFPITVQQFYKYIFTENEWFKKFMSELKTSDYASTVWVRDRNGLETRNCTYSMALNHAMAPKNVIVNEKQVLTHFPKPEDGIIIFKETQNSGVPYSDNFDVKCTYCISRVGQTSCRVRVHGGIHYKKGTWSIIKGYIEKGTHQGLDDHFRLLEKMLNEECETLSRNLSEKEPTSQLRHRKSKDSTAKQNRQSKIEPLSVESASSTSSSTVETTLITSKPVEAQNIQQVVDYSKQLWIIIAVFTVFLISNFLVLSRIQTNSSSTESPKLEPLIQSLMSEIEKLQEQISNLKSKTDL
ncbi:unnamed protein product [Caenorhabditis angaria]|uniref:VASt domain-containing protein n=1 Tax=Caenorhabditis angaria TaxID=860376 RepID=A0A9P1I641_9PELO|nr:unnamed protein product [Caenorhabditis angaria]